MLVMFTYFSSLSVKDLNDTISHMGRHCQLIKRSPDYNTHSYGESLVHYIPPLLFYKKMLVMCDLITRMYISTNHKINV